MSTPRIGSLFTGYGGLDMAVETVLGGTTAWHCENDPAPTAVLAHHHPHIPNLGDITTADWDTTPPVDILCGGFPCQDVSAAGRRAGITPHTRSGLWAHFATAIDQLRPRLVVIENVRGLLSAQATHPGHDAVEPCPGCLGEGHGEPALRALGAVLGDLADLGFDAEWASVRASDVGAPHQRLRVIVLAWPAADTGRHPRAENDPDRCTAAGHRRTAADTADDGRERGWPARRGGDGSTDFGSATTDASCDGRQQGRPESAGLVGGPHAPKCGTPVVTDWGPYGPAIARWEQLTRPAPPPTETGTKGQPRLSPAFVEWMMGLPDGWVTAVPGLTRNQQLKALGNGVVPQQAAHALTALLARFAPPATEDGEAA